ncbi:MAG: hypothetical protein WCL07_01455 [bacterium]
MILVPWKIMWRVDLSQAPKMLWRSKVIKRIEKPIYCEQLNFELLPSSDTLRIFLPMYQENIMNRADFRLDKEKTLKRLMEIDVDPEYKIFVMKTIDDNKVIGGAIFHLLPQEVRIAYRVYDHELANNIGLREMDYYAEWCLQNYIRKLGYQWLLHGTDKHPISQPGLSAFKIAVGARPIIYTGNENNDPIEIDEQQWIEHYGILGFYSNPDVLGHYKTLNLMGNTESEAAKSLRVLAEWAKIKVEYLL